MLRSMFSGVSGMRNHQVKMDVLSNNIANVNTTGYKASRVSFQEMYNQTIASAAQPSATGSAGGINPKQIGLGVSTQAIDVLHSQGATQTTDRPLDLMVDGEGFFLVTQGSSEAGDEMGIQGNDFYTRSGNFYLDEFGYLVTGNGLYLQGVMVMSLDDYFTEELLPADTVSRVTSDTSIKVQDGFLPMSADDSGAIADEALPWYMDVTDGANSEGLQSRADNVGRIAIPSYFTELAIDQNGIVTGVDGSGNVVQIAILATATFVNPSGLTRTSNNLYAVSANSGAPALSFPGMGANGTLKSGALEMSNVDLSKEFTDMIITQRGFQANSRVITVSDTLLEELINLKR